MPTKRTRRARDSKRKITPAAIEAFKAGDVTTLHRELRLPPWQVSPLDVDDGPSPWHSGTGGAETWGDSQELRRELEKASAGGKHKS